MQKCAVKKWNVIYVLNHNCICFEHYCLSLGSCCHIAAHWEPPNVYEVTACVKFFLWPLEEPLQHLKTPQTAQWQTVKAVCWRRNSAAGRLFYFFLFETLQWNQLCKSSSNRRCGPPGAHIQPRTPGGLPSHAIRYQTCTSLCKSGRIFSELFHCLPVTHIAALLKCSCFLGRCCGLWLKLLLPGKRSNLASL